MEAETVYVCCPFEASVASQLALLAAGAVAQSVSTPETTPIDVGEKAGNESHGGGGKPTTPHREPTKSDEYHGDRS